MPNEPQLHLTPYTIALAITTVVAILASPLASSVVPPNVQAWCSLLSVILPALMAVLFVTKTATFKAFLARLRK